MDDVKVALLDKPTIVSELVTSQRRGSMSIARHKNIAVAYVPVQLDLIEPLALSLQNDLLGQPLTLDAQLALTRAQHGDLQAAAGKIHHIGLVGLTTRYTTLPEDDRGLVRLGTFYDHADRIRFNDVLVLLLIRPEWLAHEYFFVDLSPGNGGT